MTLVLVAIDGDTFAIRADRIEKTVAISGASRMAQQRPDLVAAVVDGEVRFFSDLAVRMGVGAPVGSTGAGIVLERAGRIAGLVVADAPQQIGFEDHRILPIADSVGHDLFDACAFFADQSIPVLSDAFLARLDDGASVGETRLRVNADVSAPANHLTRLTAAGRHYVVATEQPLARLERSPATVALPGSTDAVAGMAAYDGAMVPVVDFARRLGHDRQPTAGAVAACAVGDATVLLLADEIGAEVHDAPQPVELSPLLASPTVGEAVMVDGEPLPLVRGAGLADSEDESGTPDESATAFAEHFLDSDVTVVEFTLGDSVYAVPYAETAEPPDDLRPTGFPVQHALVSGAYAHGGRLVPALDLAGYLGYEPGTNEGAEPILIRSGDVEAVLAPARVDGRREVPRHDQRELPVRPAHGVVYGCYVHGDDVRLILNVGAIARHGSDPAVQTALAGLVGRPEPAADETHVDSATETTDDGGAAGEPNEPAEPHTEQTGPQAGEAPFPDDAPAPAQEPAHEPPTPVEQPAERAATEEPDAAAEAPAANEETVSAPDDERGTTKRDATVEATSTTTPAPSATDGSPATDAAPEAAEPEPDAAERPHPAAPDGSTAAEPASTPRPRRRRALVATLLLLGAAVAFAAFVYPGAERIASLLPFGNVIDGEDAAAASGEAPARDAPPDDTRQAPAAEGEPATESGSEEPAAEPGLAAALDEVVYFTPDSALLQPRARRTLDSLARTLPEDEAWTLEVVGHAARVGAAETSQALSEERAEVVADYLLERLDPVPSSVAVRGMGARDPAASNATPEGRELNRRVEIFARERQ